MPVCFVTRTETFCAAHRLFHPALSQEENARLYGPCANPNGHGHNYKLSVTVRGEVDPATGMLIELGELSGILRSRVIDKLDHHNLNLDVDFMAGIIPTSENLLAAIWRELEPALPRGDLWELRLEENEQNVVLLRKEC